jgi:hypothetical protein
LIVILSITFKQKQNSPQVLQHAESRAHQVVKGFGRRTVPKRTETYSCNTAKTVHITGAMKT